MSKQYKDLEALKDDREFAFGKIWKLRDELIRLLPSDRVVNKRNLHPSRTVLVVQNCLENNDEESLLIRVAPITTTIRFLQKFDVLLYPNEGDIKRDDVLRKCMAQIQLTQPILKKDMYEKVGEISNEKKEEVAAIKLELLGINLDDLLQE
ncbi:type II toxin-antitoxin system PemK/MazF family toxin [Paratissierella segnis]|uniref:Type II toxin-antitoxin system PemK/MazF family toxin n=1 Tax=Paratissierella segnis TaxID=2763679 RepID=A0A926IK94_9FIRM|nr:type II toxin-antitoxin system PemK/MazF family toxin [Paratissierella segnis]MBC8587473.1 type II toxin-antitoxin system PemK/MazF family toxin [Paratissierella segnis]